LFNALLNKWLIQYNTIQHLFVLHSAVIHDTNISEPEALREKDENNQETKEEGAVSKRKVLGAVSKRKVLRCDLKISFCS